MTDKELLKRAFLLGHNSDTEEFTWRMMDDLKEEFGEEYESDLQTALEDAYITGIVRGWYARAEDYAKDLARFEDGESA